jgi:leucyl aminopeptidase
MRCGGSTAAAFLGSFVERKKVAWAHIDCAGPAMASKDGGWRWTKGGTGYGTLTLLNWVRGGCRGALHA